MKELDKTKVYSLEDLTSEERKKLYEHLCNLNEELKLISVYEYDILEYKTYNEWCYWYKENSIKYKYTTHNAKELFYTLENVQVDCRELSEKQIKEMDDVFEKSGYKTWEYDDALTVDEFNYLLEFCFGEVFVSEGSEDKTTINYNKFMELFADETHEVTDKPKHYSKGIDTFARMEANCTKEECLAFAKGNIDKYNFRTKGQDLEDYKKIVSYANWAIKLLKDEK